MSIKIFKSKIIILVCGIVIGIAVMIIFALIVGKNSFGKLPINRPLTLGNIAIWAIEDDDPNDDIAESIFIKKDGVNFFCAEIDKNHKVKYIAIVSANNDFRFFMDSSSRPGEWINATYSYDKGHKTIGDEYIDLNFDGRFDTKLTFDNNGNRKSVYISLNGQWEKVDSIKNGEEALIDGKTYVFSDISGWSLK